MPKKTNDQLNKHDLKITKMTKKMKKNDQNDQITKNDHKMTKIVRNVKKLPKNYQKPPKMTTNAPK
jgi:hypothetical protein